MEIQQSQVRKSTKQALRHVGERKRPHLFLMAAAATLLVAGLVGCGSTSGTKVSSGDVDQIIKGKTTCAEVVARFGPPPVVVRNGANGDETLAYTYQSAKMTVAPQTFIPIVGTFVGRADTVSETQRLYIYIDKRGVVKNYTFDEVSGRTQHQGRGPFSNSSTTTVNSTTR